MKNTFKLAVLCFALALVSCKKEPLSYSDFEGNWKCDGYTYVYWAGEDTSISTESRVEHIDVPCTMNLTEGNEYYFGIGESTMPLQLDPDFSGSYENSTPRMFSGPFAVQSSGDQLTGVNIWDMTECIVQYGQNRELRATCQFKKISANKMNVKVLLRMTTGQTHKYTYALLEMEK